MSAPMQRAVDAAVTALETPGNGLLRPEEAARIAITAAYPHLFQSLAKENRELRAEVARLNELLSPTQ